jgi:hypothetical protein
MGGVVKTVISRDLTFWYKGELYHCNKLESHGTYEVWRDKDGASVGDDFDTLADIRAYVDESRRLGYPLVEPI